MENVDEKFREVDEATAELEPATVPPAAEPPAFVPVTVMGGECSDLGLLPGRFDQFATKTEQALAQLAAGMELLNKNVLPLIAKLEKRQDADHQALLGEAHRNDRQDQRLDAIEAELAALRKPAPTKVQRPTKRAGRKNVR